MPLPKPHGATSKSQSVINGIMQKEARQKNNNSTDHSINLLIWEGIGGSLGCFHSCAKLS